MYDYSVLSFSSSRFFEGFIHFSRPYTVVVWEQHLLGYIVCGMSRVNGYAVGLEAMREGPVDTLFV